jgi:hypothetical protein
VRPIIRNAQKRIVHTEPLFAINKMKTRLTQIALDDLTDGFTGRDGMEGYNPDKQIKLYELNRDFVWNEVMQTGLIVSVLTGYPIPPITTCNGYIVDGGNRTTTLWRFKNGLFSVALDGVEQTYETVSGNRELSKLWDKCQVPIVEITEATSDNISDIYQNLNNGVKLTIGQLLENRKHIPVVDAALSIIGRSQNNSQYPHRELTNRVWNKVFGKSKTRTEVAFAFQLLVGTMYGPHFFHTSFSRHVEDILTKRATAVDFTRLGTLLAILDEVDPDNAVPRAKKSICFRKFAGAMIHDMGDPNHETNKNCPPMPADEFKTKWQAMFLKAYNVLEAKHLKAIFEVGVDRARNDTRIKAVSKNVQKFLDGTLEAESVDGSVHESDEEY